MDANLTTGFVLIAAVAVVIIAQQVRILFLRRKLQDALFGTQKRSIQLTYLIKASQKLSSALSKEKLLRLIIETFGEIIKSDKSSGLCSLFLLDYNTNEYSYATGFNMDVTMLSKSAFTMDEVPFKVLKRSREAIFFERDDNMKGIFFKPGKLHMLSDADYALFIPLTVEEDAIGVIVCFLSSPTFDFLKNDIDLLQALTGQAAIALGSAVQSELAVLDRLTRVYNHAYFESRLEQEIARSNRYKYPVSLLMIDIDNFKKINDTFGHLQGDAVLKEIAHIIKSNIRIVDLCARYGGEEFAVILPETDLVAVSERGAEKLDDVGGALAKADNLRKLIEKTWITPQPDMSPLRVTISIGIGVKHTDDQVSIKDMLIKAADKQLYRAKQEGRNRICY